MPARSGPEVTLSGHRSGRYVIVEERGDGTLVLAPSRRPAPPPDEPIRGRLSGLLRPARPRKSAPELLSEWGVRLALDEAVREFVVADLDGETGFAAVTDRRLIFVRHEGRQISPPETWPLEALDGCTLERRRRRQVLAFPGAERERVFTAPDQGSIERLAQALDPP